MGRRKKKREKKWKKGMYVALSPVGAEAAVIATITTRHPPALYCSLLGGGFGWIP